MNAGNVVLTFTAFANQSYTVESAPSLSGPWTPFQDLAAVAVGVLTLVLPVVAGILALALVGAGLYLAYRIHRAYRDLKGKLAEVRARRAAGAEPGV